MNAARFFAILLIACGLHAGAARAQSPYNSSADFTKYAMKLRESSILNLEPRVLVPTRARPMLGATGAGSTGWKTGIITTIFWVGESASQNNPVHNRSSSWDMNWSTSFGGFDDPNVANRRNYIPAAFTPKQNPFYVALPYNDVTRGTTKPEVAKVIPWHSKTFVKEGQSICKDRWVAIRNPRTRAVAYAQWSDCGPFRTDHYQYVFGNERPKPNLNGGAGLDVSPAVRDYLKIGSTDVTDWQFINFNDVPKGPWALHGDNNDFVNRGRNSNNRVAGATSTLPPVVRAPASRSEMPRIITR